MQNESVQRKPNYLIHLIYAGSIGLAVLAFIGYQGAIKRNKINCITEASKTYSEEWVAACKRNAKRISDFLNLCAGDKNCKQAFGMLGTPDPTPSCALPEKMANNIDKHFEDSKKMCMELG